MQHVALHVVIFDHQRSGVVYNFGVIQEVICWKKLSDAGVENGWIEREEELCVVSIYM